MESGFVSIEQAVAHMAAGRMVVITDTEHPDNEGNLVVAAQHATPDVVNFMVRHACGLVALALSPERCDELGLLPMTRRSDASIETAFTVSIEARHGVTTGISAHDRARTIQVAIDPASSADDVVHPGHIFPLRACAGGVLERPGPTEAAVDLARLAGLRPATVICEILDEDGATADVTDLQAFCRRHDVAMLAIEELTAYRRRHERLVERVISAQLPTAHGEFRIVGYRTILTGEEHVALVKGDIAGRTNVLARLHSQCLTGDALGSARCDCGGDLQDAMRQIAREDGVLVHLAQPLHGAVSQIRAHSLRDEHGSDALDADLGLGHAVDDRDFAVSAQILRDLGVSSVRLMTNDARGVAGLEAEGIPVTERVPLERPATLDNVAYLRAKRDRLGHQQPPGLLPVPSDAGALVGAGSEADEDHSWIPSFEMAI